MSKKIVDNLKYKKYLKRFLDVFFSILLLIVLSPVIIIVSLLVYIKIGSPIIFKQKRPGKDEIIFNMFKFRTMTNDRDENGNVLPDEERLTSFGKILRSTSLDELPELWNILKGDMSFVGPRPLLVRDMVFMNEEQRKRHKVRPGLSGLAQVSGRNAISWYKKLQLDLEYINNINFKDDAIIIYKTIIQVLLRKKSGFTDVSCNEIELTDDFGDFLIRNKLISKEEYRNKQKEAMIILEVADGKI